MVKLSKISSRYTALAPKGSAVWWMCVCVCGRVISVTLNSLSCVISDWGYRVRGQSRNSCMRDKRKQSDAVHHPLYMHHSLDRNVFKRPEFNIQLHHLHTQKFQFCCRLQLNFKRAHIHTHQLSPHPFPNACATFWLHTLIVHTNTHLRGVSSSNWKKALGLTPLLHNGLTFSVWRQQCACFFYITHPFSSQNWWAHY